MELSRDFSEFIASCAAHGVRFMIVGGYAVAAMHHHGARVSADVTDREGPRSSLPGPLS